LNDILLKYKRIKISDIQVFYPGNLRKLQIFSGRKNRIYFFDSGYKRKEAVENFSDSLFFYMRNKPRRLSVSLGVL